MHVLDLLLRQSEFDRHLLYLTVDNGNPRLEHRLSFPLTFEFGETKIASGHIGLQFPNPLGHFQKAVIGII